MRIGVSKEGNQIKMTIEKRGKQNEKYLFLDKMVSVFSGEEGSEERVCTFRFNNDKEAQSILTEVLETKVKEFFEGEKDG